MATVIDSLIVKLGLDSTDFQRGEKRVADGLDNTRKRTERTGRQVEASGKQAAEFFGQMQSAAVRFFAVLTVGRGLSDFTRTIIQTGAQLDRMAKNFGTSTDRLSRWTAAVKVNGGTAEGFLGTMQGLSSALTELKLTGNTGILPYLQALGVSLVDDEGKVKSLERVLQDIGEGLRTKTTSKADAFNIGKTIGIDDATLNLLLKGRAEVEKLLAAQKAYSQADADAARKAAENWEQVKVKIERTTQELVIKLLPTLEKLAKSMERFAEVAVPVLTVVVDQFVKLDEATDGWATTLGLALVTLRLITGPGIIGGLGKLAARITKLGAVGAVGAAGVGGYALGTEINDRFVSGTSVGDFIGEWLNRVAAAFGNEESARAVALNNGQAVPAPSAPIQQGTGRTRAERNNNPGNLEYSPNQAVPAPSAPIQKGTGRTRAERNNNPGNLEYSPNNDWVGKLSRDKSIEKRFERFQTAAHGVRALAVLLQNYGKSGINSIDGIVSKFAPKNENNTQAYIAALSKRLGVGGSDQLDLSDSITLAQLVRGISTHEAGSNYLRDQDVMSGLQMAGVRGGGQGGNTVSIGEVKVYTQAIDANGIARDMNAALIRQADVGMR